MTASITGRSCIGGSPSSRKSPRSSKKGRKVVTSGSSDDASDEGNCRSSPTRPNMRHINKLYGDYTRRMVKLEELREQEATREKADLKNQWEEAMNITRKKLAPQSPVAASERLYNEYKEMQRRQQERCEHLFLQEQRNIEEERISAMPTRSCSTPTLSKSFSARTLMSPQPGDVWEVTDRLYSDAVRRERTRIENQLLQEEMELRTCLSTRPPPSPSGEDFRNGQSVHESLYSEAEARRVRLEKKREDLDQRELQEIERLANITRQKPQEDEREPHRLDALYRDAFDRQKRLAEKRYKKDSEEQKRFEEMQAVTHTCSRPSIVDDPRSPRSVRSSVRAKEEQEAQSKNRRAREEARRRRWDPLGPSEPRLSQAPSVDHAIALTMGALSCRLACLPPVGELKGLRGSLQKATDVYRDALKNCEASEGYMLMSSRPSQRLFGDHLVCEFEGSTSNSEPGPLRQMVEDPEELLMQAQEAQVALKRLVSSDEKWAEGGKRPQPENVPTALFAYDPGVKSETSARAKALVQYGPAEGGKRHRHVTDLARLLLVFANCEMLYAGLEQIFRRFEVVDVRNRFVSPELLGGRFVEVLVVVHTTGESGGPAGPHLCELRLEEMCFYKARSHATPHVEHYLDLLTKMGTSCSDSACVVQLGKSVLGKPLVSKHLRVFRCHVAKRYGSSVQCWRKALGNTRTLSFTKFRQVCNELKCEGYCTELWEELDATRSGTISLFELDPETTALLIRFRARVLAMADVSSDTEKVDVDTLFLRSTYRLKLETPRTIFLKEFRALATLLGFNGTDADRIFVALGDRGGSNDTPPAAVSMGDFAWMLRMQNLVYGPHVALESVDSGGGNSLRSVTWGHNAPRLRVQKGETGPRWSTGAMNKHRSATLGKEIAAQQWKGPKSALRAAGAPNHVRGGGGGRPSPAASPAASPATLVSFAALSSEMVPSPGNSISVNTTGEVSEGTYLNESSAPLSATPAVADAAPTTATVVVVPGAAMAPSMQQQNSQNSPSWPSREERPTEDSSPEHSKRLARVEEEVEEVEEVEEDDEDSTDVGTASPERIEHTSSFPRRPPGATSEEEFEEEGIYEDLTIGRESQAQLTQLQDGMWVDEDELFDDEETF